LGSNRCPLFTMLTKQKFFNVLRSKHVKKTEGLPGLLSDPLSQGLRFSKESGLLILGDLPILKKKWSIFKGDLPTWTHCGLFSRATCPHIHTLVYFHGRPAHTYSHWSIFTGDLPTHTHACLFSRATCPHTHCGLFSGATCPHILVVVYFQGRPALLIGLAWDPIWRSPLTRTKSWCIAQSTWNPIWRFPLTKAKLCVWLG
jgi:hypothetical protein